MLGLKQMVVEGSDVLLLAARFVYYYTPAMFWLLWSVLQISTYYFEELFSSAKL